MSTLVVDVETTTYNKGSPFDERNFLVCIAYYDGSTASVFRPSDSESVRKFRAALGNANVVVGHNFKFDYHWLCKAGFAEDLAKVTIRDTMLMEYLLTRQQAKLASLQSLATKYTNRQKLNVVEEQYWAVDIQTDQIPWDTLAEYAAMDVVITWEVWEAQKQKLPPSMRPLLALASQDLVVLKDMETSGIRFDREGSLAHAEKLEEQIAEIQASLSLYHSVPCFNWNSNDHLSALLFGGTITEVVKVPDGIYGPKAAKAGQVKYKNQTKEYVLPRLLNPPKGAETAKEGVFSVEENVLKTLSTKKHAKLLDSILEIKKLQKDISTYLRGFPNKQDEGYYSKEYIYGNFNQCITLTGRLSSSKPNLQNPSDNVLRYMVSRYE